MKRRALAGALLSWLLVGCAPPRQHEAKIRVLQVGLAARLFASAPTRPARKRTLPPAPPSSAALVDDGAGGFGGEHHVAPD